MKRLILSLLLIGITMTYAQEKTSVQQTILKLEKQALERWNQGDPSGFLELSAPDVVYFDPFTPKRLNGLEELTKLYESFRGQAKVDRYEMIDPLVQATSQMVVLTYNLNSFVGEKVYKWNSTEVFRLEPDGTWKIIQSHWSLTQPQLK